MSGETEWRWADPQGQQRLIRTDELRAALANGVIPPNAPVWRPGWTDWKAAFDVPELTTSALSAANGVVPNIPPPPLFVVAAQTAFEASPKPPGAAPSGAARTKGGEPPPPPRYVPAPVKPTDPPSSSPSLSRPPASVSASARSGPASRPSGALRTPPISQRMSATEALKRAVPSSPPKAPSGSQKAAMPPSASHKAVMPLPAPAPADTQPDIGAVPAKERTTPREPAKPNMSVPTVMGVPRIADPRTTSAPPKAPEPTPMMPTAADRRAAKSGRSTLLFDGSAPTEPESPPKNAPPIVAPGSGGAEKNAVTRPPPMDMGTVRMNAATPRERDSSEELSGSMLIEQTDNGPKVSKPPPLPPGGQRSVKPAPPGLRALASAKPGALSRPPAPPIDGYGKVAEEASVATVHGIGAPASVAPSSTSKPATPPPAGVAPSGGNPLSPATLLGVGAIRAPEPPPADLFAQVGEPAPESAPVREKSAPVVLPLGAARPPWLEKIIDRFPQLRPIAEGKPVFFLPVVGGLGALVALVVFGMLVRGCFSLFSSDDKKMARHKTDTETTEPATTATATSTATAADTASAAAPAPETTAPPCRALGANKTLAPKAVVGTGLEVVSFGKTVGLGFAASAKEGVAMEIEPGALAVVATAHAKGADIKRVTPSQSQGRLTAIADVDKRGDALAFGRTIAAPNPFEIGVADGQLAWAARGGAPTKLWPLAGDAAIDAMHAAPDGAGWVLTFRRGASIFVGSIGSQMTALGSLVETPSLGSQVGSPAVGASGDAALVLFADRPSAEQSWTIRMRRIMRQGAEETRAFEPPGGPGAPFIAPSVVGLGGRRFFVVWTEGPPQNHQVRGATLDANLQIEGAPFALSAVGVNAGQPQAALGDGGRGVVAYLVANGHGFEVAAASVTCGAQ